MAGTQDSAMVCASWAIYMGGSQTESLCCSGEEVEKEACFTLGLLAIKQEHQHAIADQASKPSARAPCLSLLVPLCPAQLFSYEA